MKKREVAIVGDSTLGKAVFAIKKIKRDKLIGSIDGQIIEDDDYSSDYCMDLGEGRVLEPEGPFRFLNHSCKPNCELVVWEGEGSEWELCLHSVRPIKPGDELTIDYAWSADSAIPCNCGTKACRGWIVASHEVALMPQVL